MTLMLSVSGFDGQKLLLDRACTALIHGENRMARVIFALLTVVLAPRARSSPITLHRYLSARIAEFHLPSPF